MSDISTFLLVSVAEQAGLSLAYRRNMKTSSYQAVGTEV